MPPQKNSSPSPWALSRVADLAFVASLAAPTVARTSGWPSSRGLERFWEAVRQLRLGWQQKLPETPGPGALPCEVLAEILVTELPIRVWATVLLCGRDATHRDDLHQIVKHAVAGLEHVRRRMYRQLLNAPDPSDPRCRAVESLRRRCDRWIDLLAGPAALSADVWDFVCDPRRARDFAEEALGDDESPTSAAVEKLATAGLRMAFLADLPGGGQSISDLEPLARAIQVELPPHLAAEIDRLSPTGPGGASSHPADNIGAETTGFLDRLTRLRSRRANP